MNKNYVHDLVGNSTLYADLINETYDIDEKICKAKKEKRKKHNKKANKKIKKLKKRQKELRNLLYLACEDKFSHKSKEEPSPWWVATLNTSLPKVLDLANTSVEYLKVKADREKK